MAWTQEKESIMRKITFHLLAVLAISASLLAACAPKAKEAEGPLTFVLIPKSVGHPFWGDLEKGMHAQAVELGVQAIFHGPELALAEGQIDLFETYLNMGVDAIGMAPNDPATVPALVQEAEDAGILFLTFDTDAPESGRSMYIGTDNVVGGEQGAEAMIELLGGEGKVAIVTGGLTALNLNQRIDGFKEAAAAYPDIEIVDTVAHGDALETGVPLIVDLLTAHPDLKGIYAVSGPNIVVEALQEQGYEPGEIIVFGFDIFEPIPTLMREGWIQGTVAQRPYMEGKLVVQWMYDIVTGAAEIPDPPFVDTGTNVVLLENLDEYLSVPH
jgi:ribose transport system substrate-binding protein